MLMRTRQSPNFMAYFPALASYPSMLGELYSAAFTAPAFNWQCSPAVTELETIVLDWLARLMNLPACFLSQGEGGGVIQGSASEAIVTVMVAARERAVKELCEGLEGKELEQKEARIRAHLIALGTSESHSATAKAAMIAGVRYRAIPLHMEDDLALTGKGLEDVLVECMEAGLEPFYLTTTLGTTSTCATDRFGEIKEVARSHPRLWIHVDAAYAGAALICEEYQDVTQHFDGFNSFDMNMHKWLLTNFDARYAFSSDRSQLSLPLRAPSFLSCLYVKKRTDLTSALSINPAFLTNPFSASGLVIDYRDWQIPLGRRFRALKIWFVLRTYGVAGLQAHIRQTVIRGLKFHSWVLDRPDLFRVLVPPAFALTVLTVVPGPQPLAAGVSPGLNNRNTPVERPGEIKHEELSTSSGDMDRANEITRLVYEKINAGGEIFLTSTVVKGVYAIRVVSANPKASEEHLRKAFDILVKTVEEIR